MVNPWLWQRMAPIRTQMPSTGMGLSVPRILLASAKPFHSSRVSPPSILRSIQGIRLAARGTPKASVGRSLLASVAETLRSISRMKVAGSASRSLLASPITFICSTSSRMLRAPAPEAAW